MTAVATAPGVEQEIVHQLADRLRCREPRLRSDEGYAARVGAVAQSDEGVAGVSVNRSSASVVVGRGGGRAPVRVAGRVCELVE